MRGTRPYVGRKAVDAAAHGRIDDAATRFAADGEAHQSRGGSGAGTGARSGRPFFQQPRIHGLAAEPNIVERQRAEAQLGDQYGARVVQALHHRGILRGHAVAIRLGAVGGGNAGGVEKILRAPRNAMQRAAIVPGGDLAVGLLGLRQAPGRA